MATAWSAEQVLALAPDAGSAKSGRELSSARKWASLGSGDDVLWGECQGSGASPYQTKVALDGPAFHCSCPSRKFPCKHGLGLFLLFANQPSALPAGEPPAWVTSWLEGRTQRAEQKAKKEQERQEKREKGEPAVDPVAQKKRETARLAKVSTGLDDLGLWISDLVRHGLTAVQGKPTSFWEDQARRLVDAQAPGVARRLRSVAALPLSGEGWQANLLERLARLHLVVEGRKRLETLPPDLQDELRAVIGLPVDQDEVRARAGVRDVWQVVGQRVEVEDRLRTQRTWLVGRETGRAALVLDFAFGTNQPLDTTLPPGTQVDAELAFFPGAAPLRALAKVRHAAPEPIGAFAGHASVCDAHAAYAAMLARNPWLELYPLVLNDVLLQRRGEQWLVRDASGRVLVLSPRFTLGWHWLGVSAGKPFTLAGEFNGATLDPLSCWLDGRFYPVATGEFEAAGGESASMGGPSEVTTLWREVAASALVGAERRPPPSPSSYGPLAEALSGLDRGNPTAQLLDLAVAITQYVRVGREPGTEAEPPAEPCPPDDITECTPATAQRLRRMLDGDTPSVLPEWLSLAVAAGRRIPADRLADVLTLARRQSELRSLLRPALGKRGRWLGALNPDWGYTGGDADQTDPEAVWQTGTRPERLLALRSLRAADPARGLALLTSTWSNEPADDRAAFVEALAVGLSQEDEPFLEAALDDRGKTVRREAVELLARLPESRFAQRMVERTAGLLRWERRGLVVELPTACDAAMIRDGVVAKPPAGLGERGWWLRQLVAATPLGCWKGLAKESPAELIKAANETEWGHEFWSAWAQSATRARDAVWAAVLLEFRPAAAEREDMLTQLLAVLDPKQRDAYLLHLLEVHPGALNAQHPASPLVRSIDTPMGPGLGRLVLRRLREAVALDEAAPRPRYDYELAILLTRLGGLLPPGLAAEVGSLWPRSEGERTYYEQAAEQMKSLLHFRYEMHQEFAR